MTHVTQLVRYVPTLASLMRRLTVAPLLLGLLIAGCGGNNDSPTEQIKAADRAFLHAVQRNDAGDACRLTADQPDCLTQFATLHAAGIKPSDTLKGDEEKRIDTMKLTVTDGRARSTRGNQFVRRNGRWLIVLKKSS